MKPAPFAYADPRTPEEALELLAQLGDDAKILAGGQSLLPLMNFRLARPSVLIDINRVDGLHALGEESDGSLRLGAMVRQRSLERWTHARAAWRLLNRALSLIGHGAIRSRGTVGGSLAHADPAAELPAVLLSHDGAVVARRRDGQRTIPAAELFQGPLTTALAPDEMLTEVHLPALPAGAGWAVEEVARRHGDFALVGVAAVVTLDANGAVSDARLTLFGVAETAIRIPEAEAVLRGQALDPATLAEAARRATERLDPPSDLQATGMYRRRVARALSERALTAAAARAGYAGGPA